MAGDCVVLALPRGGVPVALSVARMLAAPLDRLRHVADDIVCPGTPCPFCAVGLHHRDFAQVGDDEVVAALDEGDGQA
ncbi:hypothetical protein [Paracoccus fontiphilus]|uniref:Uncharacterized protein n=1 Tax=Paracoccus fontiphilus TaxID=1815556 RepID=A0ABV7IC53_9RHOB|nr:hypothetical protein [Paracoccus fontiphilus]